MLKKISLITVIAAAVMLSACSSTGVKNKFANCVYPGTNTEAPGWICDEPVDGVSVSATGSAEHSLAGHEFMKQMAETAGRVQLAQQMKIHVANMIKQYAETTGAGKSETVDKVNTSVTKQITDASLVGSRIYNERTAPDGTLYVLMGLDAKSVQEITAAAVQTSMHNDRALWQEFQAGKAQDELAAGIAAQKVQ